MKKTALVLGCILCHLASAGWAQTNPVLLAPLPALLNESSGIEANSPNDIWTHNDSGDYGRIFKIDTMGNLLRTLYFTVDTAMDCEDMTQDHLGNYYIGDFGNNLNDRTDLRIYKIPNPDSVAGDSIAPGIINFHYPDQYAFPPDSAHNNFDCEAMFHFGDSLYLFSKNRGISTYSRMYRLPDMPGNYTALLVDSFNTGNWVTSADISPSGCTMILFSEMKIWLFTHISGTRFFEGTVQQISMDYSQKEAVVFVNDSLVYITDEKLLSLGGNLYKMDLTSWINSVEEQTGSTNNLRFFPNPAHDILQIPDQGTFENISISIYNLMGRLMLKTQSRGKVDISALPEGMYMLEAAAGNRLLKGKFVKQ